MKTYIPIPLDATPEEVLKLIKQAAAKKKVKKFAGGGGQSPSISSPQTTGSTPSPALARIRKARFSPTVDIDEVQPDKNLVFGWANISFTPDGTQVDDLQGHRIDIEDLEEAAYNFAINYRKTGDMHSGEAFGDMVESMVFTPDKIAALGLDPGDVPQGWWIGYKLPPDQFAKVKSGERKMMSIQGKARLEPID